MSEIIPPAQCKTLLAVAVFLAFLGLLGALGGAWDAALAGLILGAGYAALAVWGRWPGWLL